MVAVAAKEAATEAAVEAAAEATAATAVAAATEGAAATKAAATTKGAGATEGAAATTIRPTRISELFGGEKTSSVLFPPPTTKTPHAVICSISLTKR